MTPFERARKIYSSLRCKMLTPELAKDDIAILQGSIEEAILGERQACARIAEDHYQSMTQLLHQDLSELEKSIGMNIARCIRERTNR